LIDNAKSYSRASINTLISRLERAAASIFGRNPRRGLSVSLALRLHHVAAYRSGRIDCIRAHEIAMHEDSRRRCDVRALSACLLFHSPDGFSCFNSRVTDARSRSDLSTVPTRTRTRTSAMSERSPHSIQRSIRLIVARDAARVRGCQLNRRMARGSREYGARKVVSPAPSPSPLPPQS